MNGLESDLAAYYRYCLLRNIDNGMENVVPMDPEWHHKLVRRSVDEARVLFHEVYADLRENRKVPQAGEDTGAHNQLREPTFE